jgi:hypothetical protein
VKEANWVKTTPDRFDGKRWHFKREVIPVAVLSIYRNWAMVRRKGYMPFVVSIKDLKETNPVR